MSDYQKKLPEFVKTWLWYGRYLHGDTVSRINNDKSESSFRYKQAIRKIKKSKGVNQ